MQYPLHSILDLQSMYSTPSTFHKIIYTRTQKSQSSLSNYTTTLHMSLPRVKTKITRLIRPTAVQSYSNVNTIFDVNFLRKEKIYTKLKYSRCPQYDIISGGFAAIFAGFIGFLISEKFGIELVDSGDFYTALMYGVFSVFSLRPLLRIYSLTHTPYAPYSLKYGLKFWSDLFLLGINFFKDWLIILFRSHRFL